MNNNFMKFDIVEICLINLSYTITYNSMSGITKIAYSPKSFLIDSIYQIPNSSNGFINSESDIVIYNCYFFVK